MNKEDELIIQLAGKNERKAFKLLFERYYKPLCVVSIMYTKNQSEAEDIVQQVLLKVWEEHQLKNIHTSLKSFLNIAVRNASVNFLEKKKTRENYLHKIPNEEDSLNALDFLLNEEEQKIFKKAFAHLPPKSRLVFELVYFQNMAYQKAAEKLDISINTIKSHLKTCLKILRDNQALKGYFSEKNKK